MTRPATPQPPNTGAAEEAILQLARALLNLAFVERLMALDIQRNRDQAASSRRTGASGAPEWVREQRARIETFRCSASGHLAEAYETYTQFKNHRGVAGVHSNRGFLFLDSGDLECAASEAAQAFAQGAERSDLIVMARARTLQCIVEHTAIEEQGGDGGVQRDAAEVFSREAVAFAARTENRRLLARAYVWQGLTFTGSPADLDAARQCYEQVTALLQVEEPERR